MDSERPYRRHEYQRPHTTMLIWLICSIVAGFLLELVLLAPGLGSMRPLIAQLELSVSGIKQGHIWILATHSLLHDVSWPLHFLFTIVGLIFVGRELEPILGSRKLLALFAGAIGFSALCWCAANWAHGNASSYAGAGAAIFAFLVVLSEIHPGLELRLFYTPVTFRLRLFVWALLAIELLGLIFYEIPTGNTPLGLTSSAHLGGMAAGWLFFRFIYANNGWDRAASFSMPGRHRPVEGERIAVNKAAAIGRVSQRSGNLRADVDRILDKINSHGFGSLSDEEKQILDDAKDLLSKH